jgi:predicted Rossmann fold flavoprotein
LIHAKQLLLTLGGTRNRIGADLAEQFGHQVEVAAPSLFTFKIADPRIAELQGLSVPDAEVSIGEMKLRSRGPVLITHWGLSGPGILRVSAWGARGLQQCDYRFEVAINWTGGCRVEQVLDAFAKLRADSKRKVINEVQFGLPSRLWKRLVEHSLGDGEVRWPHLSKVQAKELAGQLADCRFQVVGKSMNKDEFVTCGGVSLKGVNFKTMESRTTPGLFFAGEILDIDGITGGFNFQAAWTTSRIAGEAMAERQS